MIPTTPVTKSSNALSRSVSWTTVKYNALTPPPPSSSSSSKMVMPKTPKTPKNTPVRVLKSGPNIDWQREFWDACRSGDLEGLKLMFGEHREKIQMNKIDYEELDNTALMKAAENGSLPVIEYLMEHGAASAVDNQNRNGNTALMLAAEKGCFDIVQYLVDSAMADAHLRNNQANTALIRATGKGHFDIVRFLVENAFVSVDAQNQWGLSALMIASERGDLPIVQFLVDETGALMDLESDEGYTALLKAVSMGHLPVVKFLLDKESDDEKARQARRALSLAQTKSPQNKTPSDLVQFLQSVILAAKKE